MRAIAALCSLSVWAAFPLQAGTGISSEIAASGIDATAARLSALPDPSDAEKFALGGLRFLGAAETALQLRWNVGLLPNLSGMPFLSLPMPDNPDATPFQPGMIADLFHGVAADMDEVRAPLATIPATSDMALEINLGDLWFDINASGSRDQDEDLLTVAGPMLLGWQWLDRDPATPAPVIRFDVADVAWLQAYSHFLSGFSEALLAYDPTQAITEVGTARATIDALRGPPRGDLMLGDYPEWVDIVTVFLRTLNQKPDAARALKAQSHFLAMIEDNRAFWVRVAAETDNDREWLPNDAQQSALGIDLPPGTGAAWLAVLEDAEALLKGEKLAPYLWLGDDAGVNLARLFTDPRPIDVLGWIQGVDALPYLEKGTVVTPDSWMRFEAMVSGNATLFAVMLN